MFTWTDTFIDGNSSDDTFIIDTFIQYNFINNTCIDNIFINDNLIDNTFINDTFVNDKLSLPLSMTSLSTIPIYHGLTYNWIL